MHLVSNYPNGNIYTAICPNSADQVTRELVHDGNFIDLVIKVPTNRS